MPGLYGKWMARWERDLATRDTNRVQRPFDWGSEWLERIGTPSFAGGSNGSTGRALDEFAAAAIEHSGQFFSYAPVTGYRFDGHRLTFPSPAPSGCPENDTVHALWYPAAGSQGRALVVLPQWNADEGGHVGLAKLLNKFGISALRMSMAYHAERKPAETERADYHVSSNVGRTVHAGRQSVLDARACLDWLEQLGYTRLGILGTSLGSCMAFITAAHDKRVKVGIFNHVSMYFSDVVWTGFATQYVRRSFDGHITQDDLRRYWAPISPASYLDRLSGRKLMSLLVWARHDTTFLPVYSQEVLRQFQTRHLPHQVFTLPCGHYTTGQFPFNLMDGLAMCRFAAHHL